MRIVDLVNYGFTHLTHWELRNDKIKPCMTDWDTNAGWIYAFTTDTRIRYIGITTNILASRLDGYSYQLGDTVGRLIKERLMKNIVVNIYGTIRPEVPKSLLEIEESELIIEFKPDWNVRS